MGGEGKDYSVNKRNGNVVYMTQGDAGKVSKIKGWVRGDVNVQWIRG